MKEWIETLVLCGIATNIGVETTARETYQHGYDQIFATDAMNDPHPFLRNVQA